MKCPYCNSDVGENEKYCHVCGKPLKIKCSKCGTLIDAKYVYCTECGNKLKVDDNNRSTDNTEKHTFANSANAVPSENSRKIDYPQMADEYKKETIVVQNAPNSQGAPGGASYYSTYTRLNNNTNSRPNIYANTNATSTSKKRKLPSWMLAVFGIGAILIVIFGNMGGSNDSPKNVVASTPQPTVEPTACAAVPFENGDVIVNPIGEAIAPVKINASKDESCYVYFKSDTGSAYDFAFLVKAGQSFEMDAPLGNYTFYYAAGDTWCGKALKFGKDTSYYSSDDQFTFYIDGDKVMGTELTLYTVSNRNFDTKDINEKDFPG